MTRFGVRYKAFSPQYFRVLFAILALMALNSWPGDANAGGLTKIIRYDMGGNLAERLEQIAQLDAAGTFVEIRGQCASACTMYLGLANTCVAPSALLGFHGAQSQFYGLGLPEKEYKRWTKVMADAYPNQIRRWYLKTASKVTVGVLTISGAQAILMGAHACT